MQLVIELASMSAGRHRPEANDASAQVDETSRTIARWDTDQSDAQRGNIDPGSLEKGP